MFKIIIIILSVAVIGLYLVRNNPFKNMNFNIFGSLTGGMNSVLNPITNLNNSIPGNVFNAMSTARKKF